MNHHTLPSTLTLVKHCLRKLNQFISSSLLDFDQYLWVLKTSNGKKMLRRLAGNVKMSCGDGSFSHVIWIRSCQSDLCRSVWAHPVSGCVDLTCCSSCSCCVCCQRQTLEICCSIWKVLFTRSPARVKYTKTYTHLSPELLTQLSNGVCFSISCYHKCRCSRKLTRSRGGALSRTDCYWSWLLAYSNTTP